MRGGAILATVGLSVVLSKVWNRLSQLTKDSGSDSKGTLYVDGTILMNKELFCACKGGSNNSKIIDEISLAVADH